MKKLISPVALRLLFPCILLTGNLTSSGQNLAGHYRDYFGHDLTLFSDSTFINKWGICLITSWAGGDWKRSHDTIYFFPRYIYDTIEFEGRDTLILSPDNMSGRMSCNNCNNYILQRYGANQCKEIVPFTLYYKEDKLFPLKANGALLKKVPGGKRRIFLRRNSLDKPPIVLLSWTRKYPANYTRQVN